MLAIEGRDEFAAVQIGLRKHRHANRLFELSLDRGRLSTDARRIDAAAQGRIRLDFDDGPACTDNDRRGKSRTKRLMAVPPLSANTSSRPTIGKTRSSS